MRRIRLIYFLPSPNSPSFPSRSFCPPFTHEHASHHRLPSSTSLCCAVLSQLHRIQEHAAYLATHSRPSPPGTPDQFLMAAAGLGALTAANRSYVSIYTYLSTHLSTHLSICLSISTYLSISIYIVPSLLERGLACVCQQQKERLPLASSIHSQMLGEECDRCLCLVNRFSPKPNPLGRLSGRSRAGCGRLHETNWFPYPAPTKCTWIRWGGWSWRGAARLGLVRIYR